MPIGDLIAGKYELESMIARGGMGAVWRARHVALDTHVAVKLMSAGLASSPEQRTRFTREAKAAAQLKSPHVVQIYDHGVEGETPYIVMELLAGEDLGARLRREKRLSIAATTGIARQVGRGLRKAHEMGIVHRDLKPANIFLARTDEDDEEVVKILDFGIARAGATGDSTLTGELLGSPPYMSPEQARGLKSLDHRTDQWSFGVVLYRMLAGRLPFQGDQAGDVIVKICTEEAPLFSSVAGDLPRGLDAFFLRVLHRNPDKRFASVRELVDALLEAAMPGVPARPSAPSLPEAPVFPFVPVGRTTVRMEAPFRRGAQGEPVARTAEAAAAFPVTAAPTAPPESVTAPAAPRERQPDSITTSPLVGPPMSKTVPPVPSYSPPPALPFSGNAATSSPPEGSSASDATTTSGATTRPAPSTKPARSGVHWIGWIAVAVLLGGVGALVVRAASGSRASATGPVSIDIASAAFVAPSDSAPGAETGPFAPPRASAGASARAPHSGTLPASALPTATARAAARTSASAAASAAPDPTSTTSAKRVIYE